MNPEDFEDFEDSVLYDTTKEYVVNDMLVSTIYFFRTVKVAYYNHVSNLGERYLHNFSDTKELIHERV